MKALRMLLLAIAPILGITHHAVAQSLDLIDLENGEMKLHAWIDEGEDLNEPTLRIDVSPDSYKPVNVFYLDNPYRLVVDIPSIKLRNSTFPDLVENQLVSSIRMGSHETFSRIVFDLLQDFHGLTQVSEKNTFNVIATRAGASTVSDQNLVFPVVVDTDLIAINPKAKEVTDVHLRNLSSDPLIVNVEVSRESGGTEDPDSLTASPKNITFAPGERRMLRLYYPKEGTLQKEEFYKIKLDHSNADETATIEATTPITVVVQPSLRSEKVKWKFENGYITLRNEGNITAWYCVLDAKELSAGGLCEEPTSGDTINPEQKIIIPVTDDFKGELRLSYGTEMHRYNLAEIQDSSTTASG